MVRPFSLRTGACLALFFLLLLFARPAITRADNAPRVFAFYYAWFDENSWSPNLISDLPVQPYASRDPAALGRHMDQARGAGIDAFVVSWLGPGNPTDERFKMMLDIANQKQFAMSLDFEANQYGSREALVNALTYVRDELMPHTAFVRGEANKPVLFFWREQVRSVDDWAEIRAQVDPHHDQIWIAEGVNIAYQRVFDGHHLYSVAWARDVNSTLNDWATRVRRAGADKLWVATVMPGYDDTRTARAEKFARARDHGEYYRATWNAALQSHPDFVVITSFNEWVEGSQIEPSATYGNLYLDITREFAAQFRAGENISPPPINAPTRPPARPAPTPTRGPSPVPSPTSIEFAAYRTTELLRVRAGPGATFDILGKLPRGAVLDVLARSEDSQWLAIAYPDFGALGWVSAEFVTPQTGFDQFPIELASLPLDTPAERRAPDEDVLPIWY